MSLIDNRKGAKSVLSIDFKSWIARIGTPPDLIAALESVFSELPIEAREYFQTEPDRSFVIDSAWIEGVRERCCLVLMIVLLK